MKPSEIAKHRTRTEGRMQRLLLRTGSLTTLLQIKDLVFNEDGRRPFAEYAVEMLHLAGDEGDTALAVIQDTWNFFPHRRLGGRCPAALLLDLSPGMNALDLHADR